MNVLSVKNVSYSYKDGLNERIILNNVSYDFDEGKFYTIVGESGCGKTTFLSLLAALDEPQSGGVYYCGQLINSKNSDVYRRENIGIVFQSYNLISYMNGIQNLMCAMGISDLKDKQMMKKQAVDCLNKVGIDQVKALRKINQLSGGEQQRVAIARAICRNANIIIADEPTGNLDFNNSIAVIDILKQLAHDYHKCVIVVTHSKEIAKMSDVVLKMSSEKKGIEYETY